MKEVHNFNCKNQQHKLQYEEEQRGGFYGRSHQIDLEERLGYELNIQDISLNLYPSFQFIQFWLYREFLLFSNMR